MYLLRKVYANLPVRCHHGALQGHRRVQELSLIHISTVTQKVSSGFNLNLGLFKIGRQKSTTEKFYDFLSNSQKSVFGETEIEVRHRKHELQTISSARKRMAANFLHEEFLDALYNVPLQEVIDEFGLFVITKYYSCLLYTSCYCYIHILDFC